MEQDQDSDLLPTEIILNHPRKTLDNRHLDWRPQPGTYLDINGETYAVLERRHQYQYRSGRYRLQKIALYVQSAQRPSEQSLVGGRWVIGDASCRYNADSEIIRCAVRPDGPCNGCQFYEPKT
ncbi:MAG: DUF6464 family protein [Elainellaceae cyanobacterium]